MHVRLPQNDNYFLKYLRAGRVILEDGSVGAGAAFVTYLSRCGAGWWFVGCVRNRVKIAWILRLWLGTESFAAHSFYALQGRELPVASRRASLQPASSAAASIAAF